MTQIVHLARHLGKQLLVPADNISYQNPNYDPTKNKDLLIVRGGTLSALTPNKKFKSIKCDIFTPIQERDHFIRINLLKQPDLQPKYIILDVDQSNIQQNQGENHALYEQRIIDDIAKYIPEAATTLITRTSKPGKLHIWFKVESSSTSPIVQSRYLKIVIGESTVDILMRGIVFEGYLTSWTTRNTRRTKDTVPPVSYKNSLVKDNIVNSISVESQHILYSYLSADQQKRAQNIKDKPEGLTLYRNKELSDDMKDFIEHGSTADTKVIHNIYKHLCTNSAEINPFADVIVNEGYRHFEKRKTSGTSSQPRTNTLKTIEMPLIENNHDYYNTLTLKVHSQVYLTFDEREQFLIDWLELFILPYYQVSKKYTIDGYIERYWREFTPADVPYEELIIKPGVPDPLKYSTYTFEDQPSISLLGIGPLGKNGTLLEILSLNKKKYIAVDVVTQEARHNAGTGDQKSISSVTVYDEDSFWKYVDAKFRRELEEEYQLVGMPLDLASKAIRKRFKDNRDLRKHIMNIQLDKIELVDTPALDENKLQLSDGQVTYNLYTPTPSLLIKKGDHNLAPEDNAFYMQYKASLQSTDSIYTKDGVELEMYHHPLDTSKSPATPGSYYLLALAYTLYSKTHAFGRYTIFGEGQGIGKSNLGERLPQLLFGSTLYIATDMDGILSNFGVDPSKAKIVALTETDPKALTQREQKKFDSAIKNLSDKSTYKRVERKNKDAVNVKGGVMLIETTNNRPRVESDQDRRVFPIPASGGASKDVVDTLVNKLPHTLDINSPVVVGFARYLRWLYDIHECDVLLQNALTYSVPTSSTKHNLRQDSVNYSTLVYTTIHEHCIPSTLEDYIHSSNSTLFKGILGRILYVPANGRIDDRIAVHRYDLTALAIMVSTKGGEVPVRYDNISYPANGEGVQKLKKILDAQDKLFPIDVDKGGKVHKYAVRTGWEHIMPTGNVKDRADFIYIKPSKTLKQEIHRQIHEGDTPAFVLDVTKDSDES